MSLFLNGVETNTVMLNGVDTTGVWNGEVVWGSSPVYTLTLQTDGHGTLTANTLTGYPGDTITLTPTYNTYYRFNNYSNTGGSIAGNVFTFGDTDATAKANFKVNAFTATGGFEKGSNVSYTPTGKDQTLANSIRKYAIHGAHTGTIPASWYSTSNRWNPSNASAYKITINSKMSVTAQPGTDVNWNGGWFSAQFATMINNSYTNTANYGKTKAGDRNAYNAQYNKSSITSNVQSTYSISSYIRIHNGYYGNWGSTYRFTATYIANRTSGTWTATGYAP